MAHIFISYSKKNRAYARRLADSLLERGFDIWMDDRIDYGRNWERIIFQAIDNCAAFVVVMTPDSYASDWVLRECQYADKRKKPTFPVLLAGEEFPRYGPTQYADVRDSSLPPEDFYENIAHAAPRKSASGKDITDEHAAVEAGDEYPAERPMRSGFPRRAGVLAGIVAAAALVAAVVLSQNANLLGQATPTPTEPSIPTATFFLVAPTPTDDPIAVQQQGAPQQQQQLDSLLLQDSEQLAFISDRTEKRAIFLMSLDGERVEQVFDNHQVNSIHVSSDGRKLVFSSEDTGDIYALDSDSPTFTQPLVLNPGPDYSPRWSPDGTSIAYVSERDGNPEIYVLNVVTGDEHNVSQNPAEDLEPAWSPDGAQLVFVTTRDGGRRLYSVNAAGGEEWTFAEVVGENNHPVWSPDGQQIAYMEERGDQADIYIYDFNEQRTQKITEGDPAIYSGFPEWSPDGTRIGYWSNRDGNHEIYVWTLGGGHERLTNDPANDFGVVWRPAQEDALTQQ